MKGNVYHFSARIYVNERLFTYVSVKEQIAAVIPNGVPAYEPPQLRVKHAGPVIVQACLRIKLLTSVSIRFGVAGSRASTCPGGVDSRIGAARIAAAKKKKAATSLRTPKARCRTPGDQWPARCGAA